MLRKRKHTIFVALFTLLWFFMPIGLRSQESNRGIQKYIWFDNLIGQTNTGIFKGIQYVNDYRVINDKHQFFKTSDFEAGSVTYNGQAYYDVLLKYDVYNDDLLLLNDELSNKPIMLFDKAKVTEFMIEQNSFEYILDSTSDNEVSGFFEILLTNESLKLYKKHEKKVFKRTDDQVLYYEFKNLYEYLLKVDDNYFTFKKTSELGKIFPKNNRQLRVIERTHKSLKNESFDGYVKAVLGDLILVLKRKKQEAL